MNKNVAALPRERDAETTEELIGILTAISIVAKRMAKKLTLLEQRSSQEEGAMKDERTGSIPAHAD